MSSWFEDFDFKELGDSWGLDTQTMYGIGGQLAGHGIVWAKKLASGLPAEQVFSPEMLFWAAYSILTETLSTTASEFADTTTAGIVAPAIVQYTAINTFHEQSKRDIQRLMTGEVAAVIDNQSLAGLIAAVIAKSYAPEE
jgi:hypothetical protein